MKMMEDEMPNTHLGVLLFMWIKLVRVRFLCALFMSVEGIICVLEGLLLFM